MQEKLNKRKLVYSTTERVISSLADNMDSSRTKAMLSSLRNSIGRPLEENIEAISLIYQYMPEEFYSNFGSLTYEEEAIITTLQLYAIHQQSKLDSVSGKQEKEVWDNIGSSLSYLRLGESSLPFDRRFNALITSQSFDELSNHLRQLIKILKSKQDHIKINYPKLAQDLYDFARGYDERVRLNWSRAYYSKNYKGEENEK